MTIWLSAVSIWLALVCTVGDRPDFVVTQSSHRAPGQLRITVRNRSLREIRFNISVYITKNGEWFESISSILRPDVKGTYFQRLKSKSAFTFVSDSARCTPSEDKQTRRGIQLRLLYFPTAAMTGLPEFCPVITTETTGCEPRLIMPTGLRVHRSNP